MISEKVIRKAALFVGGLLFGTAGLSILKSKDAKRLYAESAAAVLRAKEEIMTGVTAARETAGDILAEANDINEKRAEEAAAKAIADEAAKAETETAETTEADTAAETAEEA